MAVDLGEFVESLQRSVTPVGVAPASATNATWVGYLVDAFWEARLDGFMKDWEVDEDGVVTPINPDGEELPRQWVSLIVMYATMRMLTNRILAMNSVFRAKAGPVEFEQQSAASTMTEMLKQLRLSRDRLLEDLRDGAQAMTDVMLIDAYVVRSLRHAGFSPLIGA